MASQRWLKPVWEQMHRELLTAPVIHANETVVQVLHEPGKKAKTDSRMWVYRAQHKKANIGKVDCCAHEIASQSPKGNILFEYRPTRNGDHAAKFLGDYSGYLVCDGFDGHNKLRNANAADVSHTYAESLWMHFRMTRNCLPHLLLPRAWNTAMRCFCLSGNTAAAMKRMSRSPSR